MRISVKVITKTMQTSTLSQGTLEESKVLEKAFSGFSKSPQSKILRPVATMVPPPGYTRFIKNFRFGASRR